MSRPTHPGVYAVVHLPSRRRYIGGASNIDGRWRLHRSQLRRGIHPCRPLQSLWTASGESTFIFGVIEVCPKDKPFLIVREQFWLDTYRSLLLNLSPTALPQLGRSPSPSTREKISQKAMGNRRGAGHHYCGGLRESQVREILHAYAGGTTSVDLASRYGVSQTNIGRICSRRIWRNVTVPGDIEAACLARVKTRARGERNSQSRLTTDQVLEIKARFLGGASVSVLAREYGISTSSMSSIKLGKAYGYLPTPIATPGPYKSTSTST